MKKNSIRCWIGLCMAVMVSLNTGCGSSGTSGNDNTEKFSAENEIVTETESESVTDTELQQTESEIILDTEIQQEETEPPADTEVRQEEAEPPADTEVKQEEAEPPADTEVKQEEAEPPTDTVIKQEEEVQNNKPAYVVSDMVATMYAKSGVNVRSGPSVDYEKLGALNTGQQVQVTGKVESNGWYRIEYNNGTGFVSGNYLQKDKPETVTTPVQSATVSSVEKILNSAVLNPKRSDFEPLNEQLDIVFSAILTENMTTYQKVKACYDYLISNCNYGHNDGIIEYFTEYFEGYEQEVSAYGILKGHTGVCDDYSAAFSMMMQAIGLDCYVVGGQTSKAGGGYTPHAWCEMNINGTIYVFDPQVEDNIAKGGAVQYYRFCKTYAEVPDKYIKY